MRQGPEGRWPREEDCREPVRLKLLASYVRAGEWRGLERGQRRSDLRAIVKCLACGRQTPISQGLRPGARHRDDADGRPEELGWLANPSRCGASTSLTRGSAGAGPG